MNLTKKDNKVPLVLLGFLFLLIIIGEVLEFSGVFIDNYAASIMFGIIKFTGIIIVIRKGTVLKEHLYKQIIYFLISIILIGSLLKIQHWPYGNLILNIGFIGLCLVYTFRFFNKKSKVFLDVTKFLWFIVFCISAVFKINYWFYDFIQTALFLSCLFSFLHQLKPSQKLINEA